MSTFKIITDTTADLPMEYIKENDLGVMVIPYIIEGVTYGSDKEMDWKEFYSKMRQGMMPTTSQINPERAKLYLEEYLKEKKELLVLAFSSGLSGTYNNIRLAAEELMEERDDIKIRVIDTLCASLGEGLIVHKALQMQKEGKGLDETADWVETHKLNLVHVFTVDDLNHLHRGGRVSKTAAVLGTLAGIKPILHVDNEGHLIPISKVRGRKKALQELVNYMDKKMGSYRDKNDIFFISHGDTLEDAEYVRDLIREKFGIEPCLINHIGPTIGTHSGPGTIALFFMGDNR